MVSCQSLSNPMGTYYNINESLIIKLYRMKIYCLFQFRDVETSIPAAKPRAPNGVSYTN